jgi:3-dehydroquinate dehydratase
VEVHLSDPDTREEFRRVNFLRDIATERIAGKGAAGYALALRYIAGRSRTEDAR